MARKQSFYIIIGLMIARLLIGGKPLTAQDDCKLVLDATVKVFDTPTHVYVTVNTGGKSGTAESIYVGGVTYAKYQGKWISASTTRELKEIDQKNRKNNKITCRYLKDEQIEGEMTAVYSVHEVTPKSTTDSKVWISKAKGLPLRTDIDMDGGKNTISSRYEYSNVKPPM